MQTPEFCKIVSSDAASRISGGGVQPNNKKTKAQIYVLKIKFFIGIIFKRKGGQ